MSEKVNVSLEPAEETELSQEAERTPTVAENWPVHPPELGDIFKSDVKTTDPNLPADDAADKSENDAPTKNDTAQADETSKSA